ncbi:MAG: DUF6789 family protein [bacterium]
MLIAKKIFPSILIGLLATIIFTIVIHTAPLLGFFKIDLSREITTRLFKDTSQFYLVGHALHYVAGTLLAVGYHLFGRDWVAGKVKNSRFRNGMGYGTIWSIIAFIISLFFLSLIGRYKIIFTTGIFTLLAAHLLYGVIIGAFLEYEEV